MRMLEALSKIGIIGLFKTVCFNFRYLPFKQAVFMPVILTSKVSVRSMGRGRIVLDDLGGGKFGVLRIGLQDLEYCYNKPSMINIQCKLVLKGSGIHSFSPGAIIYVGEGATLEIGEGFTASHDLKIYCRHKITIGKDNMWSYYNVVMDNDGHHIFDVAGNHINGNKEVVFGNHVWMGCRCIVLKGSKIANGSIIASGTTVRKELNKENSIYGNSGPEPLKEHVMWDRKLV